MWYPEELIEEVRQRSDIVDVIGSSVKMKRTGANYVGLCPFHGEKTPSFSVSPSKQMFYCFGCHVGGDVISFVMKYENYTYQEAIQYLADRAGVKLPESTATPEDRKRDEKRTKLYEVNREAAKYFYYQLRSKNGEVGYKYLTGRKLTDETLNKWGLGFSLVSPNDLVRYLKSKGYTDEIIRDSGLAGFDEKHGLTDKFWNRVMFPIQDIRNRVIGFGGRVMSDAKPKYLNSPETIIFNKRKNLFGLNYARLSHKNYLILCEGYMDVISMHQAGFTEAVASLGTAFTSDQANVLKKYTDLVILSYDSDGAGRDAAIRAISILRENGMTSKVLNLKPCKDPDEFIKQFGAEEFQKRIDEAENSFFFEVGLLAAGLNLKDPDDKTKFMRELAEKLFNFPDEVERENYMRAVCDKYSLDHGVLKRLVATIALKNGGDFKPIERPKSGIQKKDPEENNKRVQRMLLTWLCEEPRIYGKIKDYIFPDDFTDPLYETIASALFKDLSEGIMNPAAIIGRFEDEEEQSRAAEVFNTSLIEVNEKTEREKALHDLVYNVKKSACEKRANKPDATIEDAMKQLNDKKALEKLKNMSFTLDA